MCRRGALHLHHRVDAVARTVRPMLGGRDRGAAPAPARCVARCTHVCTRIAVRGVVGARGPRRTRCGALNPRGVRVGQPLSVVVVGALLWAYDLPRPRARMRRGRRARRRLAGVVTVTVHVCVRCRVRASHAASPRRSTRAPPVHACCQRTCARPSATTSLQRRVVVRGWWRTSVSLARPHLLFSHALVRCAASTCHAAASARCTSPARHAAAAASARCTSPACHRRHRQ